MIRLEDNNNMRQLRLYIFFLSLSGIAHRAGHFTKSDSCKSIDLFSICTRVCKSEKLSYKSFDRNCTLLN